MQQFVVSESNVEGDSAFSFQLGCVLTVDTNMICLCGLTAAQVISIQSSIVFSLRWARRTFGIRAGGRMYSPTRLGYVLMR